MPNITDACSTPQLRPVAQTIADLLHSAELISDIESVALANASGRILAENVRSGIDVPGHDNSAMDGYAVRIADIAASGPTRLPVKQRIPAGSIGSELEPGSCARIFTGAPIPPGADAVVMQEQVSVSPGEETDIAEFASRPPLADNIRPQGNDIARDSVVLEAGVRLDGPMIGLAASVGVAELKVYRKLRVGVFFTGDELVEPGQPLPPGSIYNSNQYMLVSLLEGLGCEVDNLGLIADTRRATENALTRAAGGNDLIITSGGVSVGEEDHVKPAVEALGSLELWRIGIKPGKPFAFGSVAGTPFMGLPGNPVSVFVTLLILARPYLMRRQGRSETLARPMPVPIDFDWRPHLRREFLRVQLLAGDDGILKAKPFPRQGSDVLSSAVWADGLLELDEQREYRNGGLANFYSFAQLLR